MNDPFEPDTVPGVVVPSPQSIVALKALAVSLVLASVKLATSVLLGRVVPSVALARSICPVSCVGMGSPYSPLTPASRRLGTGSANRRRSQPLSDSGQVP